MNFLEKLGRELIYFDGAMGTMLQTSGLKPGQLPEELNLTNGELIKSIHLAYLNAGSDVISTNTFGANDIKMKQYGFNTEEIVTAAVALAKEAISESGRGACVALDIGSIGKLLKPFGELDFEDAIKAFAPVITSGEKAGADFILLETMTDIYEIKAGVLAAKENSSLPIVVTMMFDDKGKLLTGGDIASAVALLEGLRVDAIGLNCGLGPEQMKDNVKELLRLSSLPVIVNPNAGLPVIRDGKTIFDVKADDFADAMLEFVEMGICGAGGCCGTTPDYIRALTKLCGNRKVSVNEKYFTIVSSYSKSVIFEDRPVIIGERINPTGKSKLKAALRTGDIDYILDEGTAQADSGAHILDVNVGLPEIDEPEMMVSVVKSLQAVTNLPLQIDTADPKAMERALRIYNGKALINSVNGKQESMDAVFPIAKKYGGTIIALTLDEGGIPETAQGRFEIAKKIIEEASKYGIKPKDIVVDPLCMTIRTGEDNALVTLEAIRLIRAKLGVHVSLGVSNVSFGLPAREYLNSAFFTIALNSGLSAGIINPMNGAMMNAYYSFCALAGYDKGCIQYIERYTGEASSAPAQKAEVQKEPGLFEAILKGLKDKAYACSKELLKAEAPLDIINSKLIPALDEVGKGFETGKIFLPQLLMSADAAGSAFDAIREYLEENGGVSEKRGKVIIATVKGDIHDIGKNIVKVLLENYGYDVYDLGRDVPPEKVVQTALDEDIRFVGLSALMTTTVPAMEETIKALRKSVPGCTVVVGGAVLTQEYADAIGADYYSKDALTTVHIANKYFGFSD